MHIWTDLLARESAYLGILLALGSGPASLLSGRFDAGSRIGLAPVLGFAVGTCVATTVLEFAPAGRSYWMLIPLALASIAVAVWRHRRTGRRLSRRTLPVRDVLALLAVCGAVTAPVTFVLHEHRTVGPAAYYYTDVDSYVGEQDGAQTASILSARQALTDHTRAGARFGDLTQWDWSFITSLNSNLDAAPLNANVDALLGLGATDTNSAFLVVMLLMGALGAFAAVRYATRSRTWMAALAGALFGGPLFLELWFDSYQAAIVALGLLMPFCMLGAEVLRTRRRADLCLLALIVACLLTVYPLFIPVLGGAGALVLAWLAWRRWREKTPVLGQLRPVAISIVLLVVLAITFDLVAVTRDVPYYIKVADNAFPLPRVGWRLPAEVIPGWLAQTREFWLLTSPGSGGAKQIALGALVPAVFLIFIVVGLRRYRAGLALVLLAGLFILAADYSYSSRDACTYCAERDLLPLAPVVAVLLALGLAALTAASVRRARVLGMAGAVLVVAAVGQRAHVELQRFSHGSYFMDSAVRSTLSHLPSSAGAVQLEGFGETTSAQAEQPLTYRLADERLRGRVSIVLGSDLNNGIEYLDLGVVYPPGPEFHSDYEYVLTRLAGVQTGRSVVARSGGIALERRTQPLDVLTYSGILAPLDRLDPTGTAWVQPELPLLMYVSGREPGHVWVRLSLAGREPVNIPPQWGVRARAYGHKLVVCVPALGSAPIRSAALRISAGVVPGSVPPELFPPAVPQEGVALTAMDAVVGHCVP